MIIPERNTTLADNIIAFIRKLPLTDGEAVGQRQTVDPWQELWIRSVYEPIKDDGRRLVREAILSCARKNNKSGLITSTPRPKAALWTTVTVGSRQTRRWPLGSVLTPSRRRLKTRSMSQ